MAEKSLITETTERLAITLNTFILVGVIILVKTVFTVLGGKKL